MIVSAIAQYWEMTDMRRPGVVPAPPHKGRITVVASGAYGVLHVAAARVGAVPPAVNMKDPCSAQRRPAMSVTADPPGHARRGTVRRVPGAAIADRYPGRGRSAGLPSALISTFPITSHDVHWGWLTALGGLLPDSAYPDRVRLTAWTGQ